jgi:diaminohydroxyphosphoribosylaminopyrimidine deaminase/5-amino-6-(5-phosphoribosylamino)uracil reductase
MKRPPSDIEFMALALGEARKGLGCTRPNPAVGAALVREGALISTGYHRFAGAPHAEIEALRAAPPDRIRGATMYVTLEPCDHRGRTGPCTEELIRIGVARVVVGCSDPNPQVAGRGIARLRAAGIEVTIGVLEAESRWLNQAYFKHVRTGRPQVILKAATSLDGRLATRSGDSRGLTGPQALAHLHTLRAACDAILVGVNTVLVDDPRLTVRRAGSKRRKGSLVRVVVDSRARTPTDARVVRGAGECIVATTAAAPATRRRRLERAGAEVLICRAKQGRVSLADLFTRLGRRGLMSVLVEGGGQVHGSLLRERLADCAVIYVAPRLIGGDGVPLASGAGRARIKTTGLREVTWQALGDDMVASGRLPTRRIQGK